MSRAAQIDVVVIGRGHGSKTTGREIVVTANGHLLPVKKITLTCDGRSCEAVLTVDVDAVRIVDLPAEIRELLTGDAAEIAVESALRKERCPWPHDEMGCNPPYPQKRCDQP